MNDDSSDKTNSTHESNRVLRAASYGLAMAEAASVSLVNKCRTRFTDIATANSRRRDTSPICKTGRERFVWAHGFICGCALGTGIFTIGLGIALFLSIQRF